MRALGHLSPQFSRKRSTRAGSKSHAATISISGTWPIAQVWDTITRSPKGTNSGFSAACIAAWITAGRSSDGSLRIATGPSPMIPNRYFCAFNSIVLP